MWIFFYTSMMYEFPKCLRVCLTVYHRFCTSPLPKLSVVFFQTRKSVQYIFSQNSWNGELGTSALSSKVKKKYICICVVRITNIFFLFPCVGAIVNLVVYIQSSNSKVNTLIFKKVWIFFLQCLYELFQETLKWRPLPFVDKKGIGEALALFGRRRGTI